MKIDLHCHTKKIKDGDGENRNVTPELFKEKIELADVKIVAITNHNAFDYNQYLLLRDAVKSSCQVWPGVEIDVSGENRYHLIVIVKPDDAEIFASKVQELFKDDDLNICEHIIEEICNAFSKFEAIYIPHYHDKKPAISENDKLKLEKMVGDKSRIFIEPRSYRTLGVLVNNDMSALIGSDVKNWQHYEDSTFAELRLSVGSFSEFLLLSRRDKSVVDSILNKKKAIDVRGKPHESVELPLKLYQDVNIIFGSKGTGKSEILKSIYNRMASEGKKCMKYIASERVDDFKRLMDTKDMEIDLSKIGVEACDNDFKCIRDWVDCIPEHFSSYVDWGNTKENNKNKSRMKITEAVHDHFCRDESFEWHKNDQKSINDAVKEFVNINLREYLDDKEREFLRTLINKLHEQILSKRTNDLVEMYALRLTNSFIDKIKALADKNSDTVSKPSTVGLSVFVQQRIKLYKAVVNILSNLSVKEHNEKFLLGTLEDKGEIFINCKYRMLCSDDKKANYSGYKITNLRLIKQTLENIKNNILDVNLAANVTKLVELCGEENVNTVKPFLSKSKQIITSDGKEYEPSNGEKGILLLEQVLHDDADAYFLDEPELGMGNSYIDTDIRPLISDLGKRRKYVLVATHNANIAVRTLPYMSIFRTYENSEYKTYVGNPFDDRLVNIENSNDVRSWTDESMHSLEGGFDAFYERRDIYESRNC